MENPFHLIRLRMVEDNKKKIKECVYVPANAKKEGLKRDIEMYERFYK